MLYSLPKMPKNLLRKIDKIDLAYSPDLFCIVEIKYYI